MRRLLALLAVALALLQAPVVEAAFGTLTLARRPLSDKRTSLRISGSVTLAGTTAQTKNVTIPAGFVVGRLAMRNNGAVTAGETVEIRLRDLDAISVTLALCSAAESGGTTRQVVAVPQTSLMGNAGDFPLPTTFELRAISTNAASTTVLDFVLELFGYGPHSEATETQ